MRIRWIVPVAKIEGYIYDNGSNDNTRCEMSGYIEKEMRQN
jgi:hypothetical protein